MLMGVPCHQCITRAACADRARATVFGYDRIAVNLQSWEADKGLSSDFGPRRVNNNFRRRS